VAIYVVLVGAVVALLVNWGRASIDVADGELRVGPAKLPLAGTGEVTALDEAQARSLRGPRGDPAAFMFIRPYLRRAVYVAVTNPAVPSLESAEVTGGTRLPWRRGRARAKRPAPGAGAPYWLVFTRHPAELAAAISASRPAAHVDGATMG
jgi:hypothetical protein